MAGARPPAARDGAQGRAAHEPPGTGRRRGRSARRAWPSAGSDSYAEPLRAACLRQPGRPPADPPDLTSARASRHSLCAGRPPAYRGRGRGPLLPAPVTSQIGRHLQASNCHEQFHPAPRHGHSHAIPHPGHDSDAHDRAAVDAAQAEGLRAAHRQRRAQRRVEYPASTLATAVWSSTDWTWASSAQPDF